ncbi:MAG: hypothetical protein JNK86_07710, partial [Alphaproteobacteria bacterium]|nr:hypothetical protein [Alphaproteobacteria bacterium]
MKKLNFCLGLLSYVFSYSVVIAQDSVRVQELLLNFYIQKTTTQETSQHTNSCYADNMGQDTQNIVSCVLINQQNQLLRVPLYHLIAESSQTRVLYAGNSEVILYANEKNARGNNTQNRIIAFNMQGKLIWSYTLQGYSNILPLGNIAIQKRGNHYIIAYIHPTLSNKPGISLAHEKIDLSGKAVSTINTGVYETTLSSGDEWFLTNWHKADEVGFMLQNLDIRSNQAGSYRIIFLDHDGKIVNRFQVKLDQNQLVNNIRHPQFLQGKFTTTRVNGVISDSQNNVFLVETHLQNQELQKQLRATLYNQQGTKLWTYTVLPDTPPKNIPNDSAACIYRDATIMPDGRYIVLCEQKTETGVQDPLYHKLLAIILNKDGTLDKRFTVLQGDDVSALVYKNGDAGDVL